MTPPRKPTPREAARIRRQDFDRELLARAVLAFERQAASLETIVLRTTPPSEALERVAKLEADNELLSRTVTDLRAELKKRRYLDG